MKQVYHSEMLVESILKKLNIEYEEILPFQKGYRNRSYPIKLKTESQKPKGVVRFESRISNLIIYKNEPDILNKIKNADAVSDYLFDQGLPTRKSLSPIIKIKFKNSTRYARLYNYLPGETISWEAYTKNHIKLLGKAMAEIHTKTKKSLNNKNRLSTTDYRLSSFPKITDVMNQQIEQMKTYFSRKSVSDAMRKKLNLDVNINAFEHFNVLTPELSKLPETILHMDLVRSNVLFVETKKAKTKKLKKTINLKPITYNLVLSGILDFEKVAIGPTIVDIARTLAFLLVDCKYKDEKKVRKYFLRSGYLKHGNGKLEGLEFLQKLLEYFWVYDFYKFLLHNPFECLKENEHYVKTYKNILSPQLGADIIMYGKFRSRSKPNI